MNISQRIKREVKRIISQFKKLSYKTKREVSRILKKLNILPSQNSFKNVGIKKSEQQTASLITPKMTNAEVLIVCAFKDRHDILEKIILETLKVNKKKQILKWFLVGSTDPDYDFIKKICEDTDSVGGCLTKNEPLGEKWNSAVYYGCKTFDTDLVGIVGSDDFISTNLILAAIKKRKTDLKNEKRFGLSAPSLYGVEQWLMVSKKDSAKDLFGIYLCHYEKNIKNMPLGSGRFYTKSFLSQCNFEIFDKNKNIHLDGRGWHLILSNEKIYSPLNIKEGALVSVKGEWKSINELEKILQAKSLKAEEFCFEGYQIIQKDFSTDTQKYFL